MRLRDLLNLPRIREGALSPLNTPTRAPAVQTTVLLDGREIPQRHRETRAEFVLRLLGEAAAGRGEFHTSGLLTP